MNKSIIRKYRFLCIISGIIMGVIFPIFSLAFMTPKSDLCQKLFVGACIIAGISVGLLSYLLGKYTVIKTIVRFNKSFKRMSNGDFTHTTSIKSDDSIGELVINLGIMKESLKELIGLVRNKAISIDKITGHYQTEIDEFVIQVNEVLQSAKEVSSDMEDVTRGSQMLDTTFKDINIAVKSMADKASEGRFKSEEIALKASDIRNEIEESTNKTDQVLVDTNKKMVKTLEDIKVVDEINQLLSGLIHISSQTNMLALNASIESSRANQNGRGFAIIAAEVRKLSEESKQNTEQISEVMEKVNMAVGELVNDTQMLLEYLNSDIKKDYQLFRNVVMEYDNNSKYIKDMVMDFSDKSEEVFASMQVAVEKVTEISKLSMNSSEKATNILDEVVKLENGSSDLVVETDTLKQDSQNLKDIVGKFKLERG